VYVCAPEADALNFVVCVHGSTGACAKSGEKQIAIPHKAATIFFINTPKPQQYIYKYTFFLQKTDKKMQVFANFYQKPAFISQ
jgi:hypothetical protein